MLPQPSTTTMPSSPSPERSMPRSTQAAGSMNTAALSQSESGTLRAARLTARSRIRTMSAKPPGSIRFSLKTAHIVSLPRRQ